MTSELARHSVVLKVDDWVFCHGGLLPHHGESSTSILILLLSIVTYFGFSPVVLFFSLFEMTDKVAGIAAVSYGIERMNMEVSHWMRGLNESNTCPQIPFIATRGYDSVVWNRLYSRDISDLEDYQIGQASKIWFMNIVPSFFLLYLRA